MALTSTITPQSIETVSRLFDLGSQGFWQLDLGSDYVAWANDERQGAWDSICLLSKAHDEGMTLTGGHELAELVSTYDPAELRFRNLVTGEEG